MINIAACFIIYNPPTNSLQNIFKVSHVINKVFVADNSAACTFSKNDFGEFKDKIVYVFDGVNNGIAARLNEICNAAIADGFEWLLTMDQDSYFEQTHLENYINTISLYNGKENVAMFGVNYESQQNKKKGTEEVEELITSGSIVNLMLFKNISGFNKDYFIDQVDTEYCLRSILKGYEIIKVNDVFMHHQLGETSNHISFKTGKPAKRSLHSPERIYYMTRNFLYLKNSYQNNFPVLIIRHQRALLNEYKNNILYNQNRLLAIKNILKGAIHYLKKKKGAV